MQYSTPNNSRFIEICRETLAVLACRHFAFQRIYNDGGLIYLTTQCHWQQYYFAKRFHLKPIDTFTPGIYFWRTFPDYYNEVLIAAKYLFDIDNGITVVDVQDQYTDFFSFSGNAADKKLLSNIFINNTESIYRIAADFKRQESYILQDIIPIATDVQVLNKEKTSKIDFSQLTASERALLPDLVSGYPLKVIASRHNKSIKTLDKQLYSVREKFNCKTTLELIILLINM